MTILIYRLYRFFHLCLGKIEDTSSAIPQCAEHEYDTIVSDCTDLSILSIFRYCAKRDGNESTRVLKYADETTGVNKTPEWGRVCHPVV
ncbi:hypothetical protein Y032_0128g1421 [Ancylostoma ceylanicum]|uniref:Uncharacterized protein n=1 Tax=Ancylostoma ceylanicum TaxID=53326 RepID=A0A016T7T5_9BILA|nr:hypothetical protein Y032_0128g1421 [Ancylostoma ceylanicum]